MKNLTLPTLIAFAIPLGLFSQNSCSDLLRDGVFSYVTELTQYNDAASAQIAICSAYQEYKKTNNSVAASGSYAEIFKAGGSYSKEQIEFIGKLYCENDSYEKYANELVSRYQTFVDPNLRAMYETCITANSEGVQIDINPSDKKTFESVTISVRELAPTSSKSRYKVTDIIYDKSKLKLNGELVKAAEKQSRLEQGYSLTATRLDIKNEPFKVGNEQLLANSQQLVIQIENRAITITFPKIYPKPPKVELTKGVGEIVASMLTEEQFLKIYGKDEWMLANGDPAPKNSKYAMFVSPTVPDLRGRFLRGKNYNRNTKSGNSKGDLPLGFSQEDALKKHDHAVTIQVDSKSNWAGGGNIDRIVGTGSTVVRTDMSAGEEETMPRNVTVNYFIRIN